MATNRKAPPILAGTWERVEIQGRTYDAFVPPPVAHLELDLSPATIRATERAAAAARAASAASAGFEGLARLLLRREGLSSSFIEGLQAGPADVAHAEVDEEVVGPAGGVADNLRALTAALAHRGALGPDDLWSWHRVLMTHAVLPDGMVGAWRDRPGWVGGHSPRDAAFIPPGPGRLDGAMADLVAFANRTDLDPVTHAAVLHAQFETTHPFADGNGRIGRLLIGWSLVRLGGLSVPPPVSLAFARDIGGYLAGLTLWRQGGADTWVRWFAGAVERAAGVATDLAGDVESLLASWAERLGGLRADAAARRVAAALVDHPVVDGALAAELAGVSAQAAHQALATLAERGIIAPVEVTAVARPGRRPRWWGATELLELVGR